MSISLPSSPANGPQACFRIHSDAPCLHLAPALPDWVPGNAQYTLIVPLPPHSDPLPLSISWPPDQPGPPGFDYPHNANFSSVLHEIIFLSTDGYHWQRVENLSPAVEQRLDLTLPPSPEPLWLSVGIPYFAFQEAALRHDLQSTPWQMEVIGHSIRGRPLYGYSRPPADPSRARGTFLLSAYQHWSEWAGPIALEALLRTPWEELPGAEEFGWAVIPVMNPDALAEGWPGDLMHNGQPHQFPEGPNMNRAWNPPVRPETLAAAAFFTRVHNTLPALHLLDFHMGWSTPANSGGGLTCFHPGELSPEKETRERVFTKHYFAHVPIEPFPWVHSALERPNAAAWATRVLGCPGQTVEISRFRGFTPQGYPIPVSDAYYQSIGPATARALISFYQAS